MGVTEKMWDAVARVIRLETALEIALAGQGMRQIGDK